MKNRDKFLSKAIGENTEVNFSTADGFFKLKKYMESFNGRWVVFQEYMDTVHNTKIMIAPSIIINPDLFADIACEFLQSPAEAAILIDIVYGFNCVGGNAHIVLDDLNIEDDDIDYCLTIAIPRNIHEGGKKQLAAERACLLALKKLNMTEREEAISGRLGR